MRPPRSGRRRLHREVPWCCQSGVIGSRNLGPRVASLSWWNGLPQWAWQGCQICWFYSRMGFFLIIFIRILKVRRNSSTFSSFRSNKNNIIRVGITAPSNLASLPINIYRVWHAYKVNANWYVNYYANKSPKTESISAVQRLICANSSGAGAKTFYSQSRWLTSTVEGSDVVATSDTTHTHGEDVCCLWLSDCAKRSDTVNMWTVGTNSRTHARMDALLWPGTTAPAR